MPNVNVWVRFFNGGRKSLGNGAYKVLDAKPVCVGCENLSLLAANHSCTKA